MRKLLLVLGLGLIGSVSAMANDVEYLGPQEAAPNIYKILFENERVRVSEIKFNPGDKAPMHKHSLDHVVYVVEPGTLTLSYPDGTSKEISGAAGQTFWIPAETHEAVNTGKTVFKATVTELK